MSEDALSRRSAAKLLGGALLAGFTAESPALAQSQSTTKRSTRSTPPRPQPTQPTDAPSEDESYSDQDDVAPPEGLTAEDNAFLMEMQQRGCLYFTEQTDQKTGQILDRAINRRSTGDRDERTTASIAATGFGLTALCIAHKEGFLASDAVQRQVLTTLDFHLNHMQHEHGFFYHFNHVSTGRPTSWSEVSSIDTAILLCGVLTCRAYFNDGRIKDLATRLYERVEWPWMLNGGTSFSMGWLPNSGFIATRWDHYCELMMLYLLAIGSRTHPVPPSAWDAFSRPEVRFRNFQYISGRDPLFVHQYSHAWFDFARQRDNYTNYFQNSVTATRAHKAWLETIKRGYTDEYWGVTASDWQHGYTAWGGPPLMGPVDGSIVPAAAAGSLPFLPKECVRTLRSCFERYGSDAWGRYGFCDAFHPEQFWYDPDVLGIDVGIGVIMAENLRTGFVWEMFMRNPEPTTAMAACNFRDDDTETTPDTPRPTARRTRRRYATTPTT